MTDSVQHFSFQQREEWEAPLSENHLPLGSEISCMYQKAKLDWETVDQDS